MFAQNDDVRKLSVRHLRRAQPERPVKRLHGISTERRLRGRPFAKQN
jgi:hypothetical protein